MRTINSYIARNMLAITGMALGILTFVLLSGHFYRAFELLSKGVPLSTLLEVIGLLLPDVLRIVLPLALLVSTVLVFSRMSADSEIIALKSMGVSIWQTVLPALAISLVFTMICLWLSLWVAPTCKYRSEVLRQEALLETPLTLLEPGEFSNAFPQCSLRIGRQDGKELHDVHIIVGEKGSHRCQDICAESGSMAFDAERGIVAFNLKNASVTNVSLERAPTPEDTKFMAAKSISLPISLVDKRHSNWSVLRKSKYQNLQELCGRIGETRLAGWDTIATELMLELHSRFAMALSPFAFLLLGLPFGIRSRRSELSVGLLVCVLLALVFYAFALLANALRKVSGMHPEIIIWIPNIVYQAVGLYMLKKLERQG